MPKFIIKISDAASADYSAAAAAECFIIDTDGDGFDVAALCHRLREAGKIVLLSGSRAAELCRSLSADGLVADLRESVKIKQDMAALRKAYPDKVLGVVCRNRRHEAMIVSENEPDFIIFKVWRDGWQKTRELAIWYSQLFLIQMAIEPEAAADFADFGADMVILSPESYKILLRKKKD